MRKKSKRQSAFAIFFWAQVLLLSSVIVFGAAYAIGRALSLSSVSELVFPIALDFVLGFQILVFGSIGFVIIFGFYRRLSRRKKLVDQKVKDKLRQVVSYTAKRMMIKKLVRPFILPGAVVAANTGKNRIVVGEKLVQQMSDQQLAGVIGHELVHGMKHHVLIKRMLLPIILGLGVILYAVAGSDPGGRILVWTVFAGMVFAEIPLAWNMEYSADLGCAKLLGRNTMIGTLACLRETHYDGPFFTHPSLSGRINRLASNPILQDMTLEIPILPVAQSSSVGGSSLEKPVATKSTDQVMAPSYVAEHAKPRFCPICGVQVAVGQMKCGSCGTNLQQWPPRD